MYKLYNKIISIIIALSFLYSNSLWALAPDAKLDKVKYARVLEILFQALSGQRAPNVSLPQGLELSLVPKERVLYLYSKNPRTSPSVIYRVYISGKSPAPVPSRPIHTEDIGKLRIEVYPRTPYWDEKIGARTDALTGEEAALLQEFIDSTDEELVRELLQRLVPQPLGSILEVNARAWEKRFKDIDDEALREIKRKGYDTIWLMGVWEISPESTRINRGRGDNFAGSAYAIMDYRINPELGTEEDLAEFSRRAKEAGVRVIVDFIPNHMAKDSPWIDMHPDWFMPHWGEVSAEDRARHSYHGTPWFFQHPSGRMIAHGALSWDQRDDPWIDTAQLNLANAELRRHLIETLKRIARLTQSGGVRCDMAMLATKIHIKGMWFRSAPQAEFDRLMPQEFWLEVISEVRKEFPDFKFMAEGYWGQEGYLQGLGFDATYDKHVYDLLAKGDIRGLKGYLNSVPKDYLARTVHFLANHDERDLLRRLRDVKQQQAAVVIQGAIPGYLLYYLDQIEGRRELSSAIYIPRMGDVEAEVKRLYSHLVPIFSQPVFRKGEFRLLQTTGERTDNVFASQRQYKDEIAVTVVNYSGEVTTVTLEPSDLDLEKEYLWSDPITGDKRLVKGKDIRGYRLDLIPWGFHIFTLVPAANLPEGEVQVLRDRGLIGVKARGPPEDQSFFGYTNDVPNVAMGTVLKVPVRDFSLELKKGGTLADLRYVMDYIVIAYYGRKRDEAIARGEKDKADVYNAYILILENIRDRIVCEIEEEDRTAIASLLGYYETIVKPAKERAVDDKARGMWEEIEFLIMEVVEHLQEKIFAEQVMAEIELFNTVLGETKREFEGQDGIITNLYTRLLAEVPDLIRDKEFRAGRAIFEVVEQMELAGSEGDVIKRFIDRMIERLEIGERASVEGDVILVCNNVPHPIKLEKLKESLGDKARVKAILCDKGAPQSHFSIFAAQEDIVAITGAHDNKGRGMFEQVKDGEMLVVYGFNGKIIRNPSQATLAQLPQLILEERAFHEYIKGNADKDAVTAQGVNIEVLGNADRPHQIEEVMKSGGEGIGLVRTEYLYDRSTLPTVEELIDKFKVLADRCREGKGIVIRLFDKQPDKKMPCLPESPWSGFQYYTNDKAGRQAVRDELKAVYLAFLECPNIRVMFPQVSTPADVDFAMRLIDEVKQEIVSEGKADRGTLDKMEIGFMVETPASVSNIECLLRHADFVSIGTNDLTELAFKVDRDDEASAGYFMKLQPVILKYIQDVLMAVRKVNSGLPAGKRKKVSICGDLARYKKFLVFILAVSDGDIQLSPSMPPRFIPLAKELIRSLDIEECRRIFKGPIDEAVDEKAQDLIDRAIEKIKGRDDYRRTMERLVQAEVASQGALIGKVIDEHGEIITEYIVGEVKGNYLYLWDTRKPKKKLVARIRCRKAYVKEEMIRELRDLITAGSLPDDSIERRYIQAIIEYPMAEDVGFYVLKEDVKNIYGFANSDIFCLYEPFLGIPASFFHEAGESFFLSNSYRAFLSQEIGHGLTDEEWAGYKSKARVIVDGEERLIPAHTYLRGLGKKARARERELTEAERLLPNAKGLEDLLFGEENVTVSTMIREQKEITRALRELEAEDWVKALVPELKNFTKFFPDKSENEIMLFIRELIQIQSVSKLLDLLLDKLLRPNGGDPNPNTNIDLLQCVSELENLLNLLSQHIPYTRTKQIIEVTREKLERPRDAASLEEWRKNIFVMKALVRFFKRIEKAELHYHLDGALSPDLILKILCLFPEARERFVRTILGRPTGSVNEIFSSEIGGPRTEEGWELLQYSLQYLFHGRVSGESDFISRFGGMSGYRKAIGAISRYLEYRPTEIGTTNINEFLKKFGLTGLALYCNPEALRILSREATLETYRRDNTTLIEQKMHNLTFGYPLFTVIQKVLQGLREAESISKDKIRTALTLCIFKNPDLVLGGRYGEVVRASEADSRSIEAIRYSIWQETEIMLRNDFAGEQSYVDLEKKELDEAIAELRRMAKTEEEARKRLLIFWEERKEGVRQIREIIRAKQQLALDYPELAKKLVAIDTVGSEIDYITWVHSYGLRLARRYGFRVIDHAGESWPEEDIWQALNRVKGAIETGAVERIGHATCLGIHPEALRESRFPDGRHMYTLGELREIERAQQRLLGMMKERGIVLETNPSSNLLLLPKYITAYARHPIHYFWKRLRDLLVVSSDDPHILHTIGLSGELSKVWLAHPNFKFGELLQIIRNGFQHTFLKDVQGPVQGPASHMPLWDGVIPEEAVELGGYHPSSVINRVRGFGKWLPVLDYQKVGEYPGELIRLEQELTICTGGWERARKGDYGTLVAPAGMPAINMMIDTVLERKGLGQSAEIIVIEPPYGCTKNLFENWQRRGVLVHSISADRVEEELPKFINEKTALIYVESITNPNLMRPSIEYILRENKGRAAVLVDDTFGTTEMARSLEIEADVGGTKYSVDMTMLGLTKGMSGTGNIISGAVTAKKEWLEALAGHRNCLPEHAEVIRALRGLRHLEIRFKAQSRNADRLVSHIAQDPLVSDAAYPGNGHMIYYVFRRLYDAISNINLLPKFRTLISAVSLGQVRNLFERPSGGTHFTVEEGSRKKGGISPAGVRGSIGIENFSDVQREIDAMLEVLAIYNGEIPEEDLNDINKIFMAEYVTQEEEQRTVRYLLPKWPIPNATFEKLISDLPKGEIERLQGRYNTDERFRRAVDRIMDATEITKYDPVTIAIHHRLFWCMLSGDHTSVVASPIESTTCQKGSDIHMQATFASILTGKKKGLLPIGNFSLYSRLGRPGIATFELLMTLLEVGAEQALNYDYIGTSFYSERMAHKSFLEQQAEIVMMNEMMEKFGKSAMDLEEMRQKDPEEYHRLQMQVREDLKKTGKEIIIITPPGSVLFREAMGLVQHDAVRFRVITPDESSDIEGILRNEVSSETVLVYFDSLRIRGKDPVRMRDIVREKNPSCVFGITDSFNLGYENPRTSRDFDFITHVIYYEDSDYGAVVIAKNDKPLTQVWNNPYWSRKNRAVAMSEDIAVMATWYILPYLRVFDDRYTQNMDMAREALEDKGSLRQIDKRHLEIVFASENERERFLSIAGRFNLINVSSTPADEYFHINEWTSLRPSGVNPNALILRIGIENTNDLRKEFGDIISRFKVSGAIGKRSCLEEKDSVPVENLNDQQNAVIREAIGRIREAIARADWTDADAERHMAEEALALLEEYLRAGNIKAFDARVKDPEDYLLAFPREKDHIIALMKESFEPGFCIPLNQFLPEILFHEGFTARFGERDYEEHRRIYQGLQRKIFGQTNLLKDALRDYIVYRIKRSNPRYRLGWRTKEDGIQNIRQALLLEAPVLYRMYFRVPELNEYELEMLRGEFYRIDGRHFYAWGIERATSAKVAPYFNGSYFHALIESFPELGLNPLGFGLRWETEEEGIESVRFVIKRERPVLYRRYCNIDSLDERQRDALRNEFYKITYSHFRIWGLEGATVGKKAPYFNNSYIDALVKSFPRLELNPLGFRLRWDTEEDAIRSIHYVIEREMPLAYQRYQRIESLSREDIDSLREKFYKITSGHFIFWGLGRVFHRRAVPYFNGSYMGALIKSFPELGLTEEGFRGYRSAKYAIRFSWRSRDEGVQNIKTVLSQEMPALYNDYLNFSSLSEEQRERLREGFYRITEAHFRVWGLHSALFSRTAPYFCGSYIDALRVSFPELGLNPFGFRLSWGTKAEGIGSVRYVIKRERPDLYQGYSNIAGLSNGQRELLRREFYRITEADFYVWGLEHVKSQSYFDYSYARALIESFPELGLNPLGFRLKWETEMDGIESVRFVVRRERPDLFERYSRLDSLSVIERDDLRKEFYRITNKHFKLWGLNGVSCREIAPYFNGSYKDALIKSFPDLELRREGFISRNTESGAIGKSSSLAEKDRVPVENLNDKEKAVIREAIDRIREAISRAGLTDAERHMAGEALALLEEYFRAGSIKVFDARVRDPEDYLLAFPRERDHIIALARDFLDPDYIIQFYHILPEILFHEGFTARFGERDYEEHRRIYQGIQRKIFGEDNEVAETLRYYINLKLPGTYEIEFDQKTLNDRNINLDRIRGLLRDKEFIYRTLMGLYGNYKFMFPHIRIGRMKVEYGGTGSQKQTLHVSFNDENMGWKMEFALKAAINRSAREGFAKGEKNEIPTLRELSGRCNIPSFGVYYEEPGNNFYVYTEDWVHGPTAARVIAKGRLTKEKLSNIVEAYLSVMKALDKRSKAGGYLGIYDVQTENVMFESWETDNAVTVDIGKIDYIKPLFILQEFDRHYSKGDPELQKAIFDGVIEVFGLNKGLEFLGEALDASSLDRREVKGFTREMALRLAGSLGEYLRDVYIRGIASQISQRLSKLAYELLDAFLEKAEPEPIMEEARLWFKKLYEDTRDAYESDMTLSNKIMLEVVELVLQSISIEDINLTPSLDSIERLLDVSFLLGFVAVEDIRYKQRDDSSRVIDILSYKPEMHRQFREDHTYPPKDTLDALELSPNDVYLNLGGGPGINNVVACLRGVKESIYLDISEINIAFVARLKKYYEYIRNNPELRDRLENQHVNVINFIRRIIGLEPVATVAGIFDNPNHWFGEETLPEGALESPNPPLKVYSADAASMPLPDDSVTKVSVLGLFKWVRAQGGVGKVIHTMREVLRVTREGGLILHRSDNPSEEDEYISYFPNVAAAMGVIIWLKRITELEEYVFEVVSKSGDLYGGVADVVNREMGLSLSGEELRVIMDTASQEDIVEAYRRDNGVVDEGDLGMTKRVAEIIRGFNVSRKTKIKLIKALVILIRKDRLKGRIRQHISYYGMLSERVKYGEVKNVFIDKECLPRNQQYILEGAEWERRRQLLERMFPGYRFDVFSGNLEAGMNKGNTIVLTNKKMDIDARLVFITNAGEEEYFPIDGLVFLGVGLLNLSPADRSGSPLASTITRLYKEITGQDIDIPKFLENENYRLDIILPPIGRFNTEVQTYAITLLEQAA